ncbi:MAG: hypothetical protein WCP03_03510, partial [Candidatus Saccharibacteria bacterium]
DLGHSFWLLGLAQHTGHGHLKGKVRQMRHQTPKSKSVSFLDTIESDITLTNSKAYANILL